MHKIKCQSMHVGYKKGKCYILYIIKNRKERSELVRMDTTISNHNNLSNVMY